MKPVILVFLLCGISEAGKILAFAYTYWAKLPASPGYSCPHNLLKQCRVLFPGLLMP